MNSDPYKVLGVSRSASDDEIKTAYRTLAKKYHPDRNPGNRAAADKMNEINAAYDAIKSGNADSYGTNYGGAGYGNAGYGGSGGYGNGPWSGWTNWAGWAGQQQGYGGYQGRQQRTELQAAENYLRAGHFSEAMTALGGVPQSERTARWYYLAALANSGMGNRINAMEYARTAVNMEPGNSDYVNFLSELQSGGATYSNFSSGFPRASFTGGNGLCMGLCVAQLIMRLCCHC